MPLFVAVLLAVALLFFVLGRRGLAAPSLPDLRWLELPLIALALQLPVFLRAFDRHGLRLALLLLSQALLLAFASRNRQLGFVRVLALGFALNLLVMVANGGYMPVTPEAVAAMHPGTTPADWPAGAPQVRGIVLARADTQLWPLSDVFVIGPPFIRPTAFSVGDVLLVAGFAWAVASSLLRPNVPLRLLRSSQ